MLLAIDVGNTHSLFALCDGDDIRHSWRVSTDPHRTEDETAVLLQGLMRQESLGFDAIHDVIISSVVPDMLFPLGCFSENYIGKKAMIVGKDAKTQPMPVKIDQPEELGADLLVNAFAAWKQHQRALMVIDFGTATTFDVVNAKGEYVGGVIAPGVNLSLEALSRGAARLHGIRICEPPSVIGTNTTHAMQSGVYFGYLGLIGEIIRQIRAELPEVDYVIATGGLASLYSRDNPLINAVEPELTVRGLMAMYERTATERT
jgi:type III pantothenate kinase